ncbi:MAG: DUF1549 domain-containing protein [Isosphaeraceae bacterium]|nr:DUF1549 domain-containing protein [Isosphaeraceae bacterium]
MIHSSIRSRIGFAAWAVLVGSMGVAAAESLAGDAIEFNRDVRPILNEHCIKCHGPDSVSRKANLRLDDPKSALASEAVVPGDPEASLLVERIESKDPEQVMPPPKSGKALKPDERRILQEWVRQGGKYQPLWSFIPPVRSKPPEVKTPGWVRNPIDQFVLAKLEESKLTPAPEADRRTLARRLSLDIVGLPPDPAEVDRFVADTSSDAYEKYVDRLLDSPHYGEHRARYWLDAARYADSHGIHFDNYREMWSYRDWVIQAFNGNMPFDRFTIEQIAGDLLPNRTLDQQIASGFNRCNITTNEGGVIAEEYLVHYTRDRTETVSAVFMGLTANCAVCHDHKFDPLSQKEFYEMAAFFNNTTQGAMDGNIKDTPPIVFVPSSVDRSRWNALTGEIAAVNAKVDERKKTAKPEFESWLKDAKRETIAATLPTAGLRLHARLDEVNPTLDSAKKGGRKSSGSLVLADAGDFERNQAFSFGAWVNLGRQDGSGAIIARMDEGAEHRGWDLWVENFKIGSHVISKWPGNALKVVSRNQLKPLEWNHVFVTYDGSSKVEGLKVYVNGVLQPVDVQASTLTDTIRTKVPLQVGKRSTGAGLPGLSAQDLRIYDRALADEEIRKLSIDAKAGWLVAKPPAERKAEEVEELFGWWLRSTDSASRDLSAQLAKLETEKAAIQGRGTIAHVMQEKPEEAMAFILHRGEYDKRRDPVKPSTPAVLPPMPKDFPRNRLGFARWLLLPEHPLTARVM